MNKATERPRKPSLLKLNKKDSDTGFILKVIDSNNDIYTITSGRSIEYEDCGGFVPIEKLMGESEPVKFNGQYYLPWHVSAALGDNGFLDRSFLSSKRPDDILETLWYLKYQYDNLDFPEFLKFLNNLVKDTPAYVY